MVQLRTCDLHFNKKEKRFLITAFDTLYTERSPALSGIKNNMQVHYSQVSDLKKTFGTIGTIGGKSFIKNPLHFSTNVNSHKDNVLI